MATPTTAPAAPQHAATPAAAISTPALITTMVKFNARVSDLIISPHRPPQVELGGHLVVVPGLPVLSAQDTARLAADLIGTNKRAADFLKNDGACDTSYSIPDLARFRVNIFRQRGTYAVVMRIIPMVIPSFEDLKLPPQLKEIASLKNGIVLVTGPTGSGKSSTLAAIIRLINETKAYHIVTIEDPIEFMHPHGKSTIHQRELHSDTPSFAHALRSAMRQAPKVIMVGEMRDRETMEIVLEAAETGHLVLSSLNTMDAAKTIERIITSFAPAEQKSVRERFAKSFRYIVCQRLMSKSDRSGRVAAFEILKANARTRECIEKGESENDDLLEAMKAGSSEGMQHFDFEIAKLVQDRVIDLETGLSFASNPATLGQELAR